MKLSGLRSETVRIAGAKIPSRVSVAAFMIGVVERKKSRRGATWQKLFVALKMDLDIEKRLVVGERFTIG